MDNSQAYTLTLTHPSNGTSRQVSPRGLNMPPRNGNPRTLSFSISQDYALFSNIGATGNPLDYGTYVVLTRNSQTLFRGYVSFMRETARGDQPQSIEITATCQSARLRKCQAHYNGLLNYERSAPLIRLTGITLLALPATAGGYGTDVVSYCYPAFSHATNSPDSTSPWIARSVSRTTTITQDMTDVATTPFTVADGRQLTAPGFLQIGTELIHFSAVYKSGSTWYVGGTILRGVLGSTAAAHSTNDQCWQRECKTIADTEHIELANAAPTIIPRRNYQVREIEGRFDFGFFVDDNPDPGWFTDCTYTCFDMDHATDRITLASIVTEWLTADVAGGGPGIAGGDIDTSGCDLILLDRVVVDESNVINPWDLIQQLINETWERRGGSSRKTSFYYSAINDKYTLESVAQQGSASVVYSHAVERTIERALDGLAGRVRVSYDMPSPTDLLSSERVYHLAIGDAANALTAGNTTVTAVSKIMYQEQELARAAGWLEDSTAADHNVQTTFLFDPDPSNGWGIKFTSGFWNAGEEGQRVLYAWFPESGGSAVAQLVDYVEAIIDSRLVCTDFYEIEIFGVDSYTPGDPPTVGNVVPLGLIWHFDNQATGVAMMVNTPIRRAPNTGNKGTNGPLGKGW